MTEIIKKAQEVIDIEIEGLKQLRDGLNGSFSRLVAACQETLAADGKLIFTGIGKSGYIGKKIAATLSSVGSPSIFMHPVEALHGDLGMMQSNDLVIALSYSGETDELLAILTPAKRLGMKLVAITGYPESRLAALCDLTVDMTVEREACPFNLAPTTSTTVLLALGDALAMVLLQERGFTKEDFGRLHPGGAIGRAVTMNISDIMRPAADCSIIAPELPLKKALLSMTSKRCGCAVVADSEQRLLGIFTDGDFRRHAERDLAVLEKPIAEVMTANPIAVQADALAVEALTLVENRHINDIVVVDADAKVVGIIDVQDLPGLKLM